MKDHPKFTFIAKPNKGKGGEGIFLISKYSDLPTYSWSTKTSELLVQRYIKHPLLIEKYEFDF